MCREMKNVLVTGADGFIGRNLVKSLLGHNVRVYAIVYPGNNVYEDIHNELLCVKAIDLNFIKEYVDEFPRNIDVMYHFAWIGVRPEQRNDLNIQMLNIQMTLGCMEFARLCGIRKFVAPGSTNEYLYCGKPINKDAVPCPSDAYGSVKVALRYLCNSYALFNGIEYIYVVISSIYAADRRDNNVIFYTIDKLLRGEKPALTKLEQLWDYVYIDDVIDALIAVGISGKSDSVYVVGHGDNWALSNYIEIIRDKIDSNLELGIGEIPYAKSVLPSSCVDLTDIYNDTGYVPRIEFEDGITRVIKSIREDMEK